MKRLLILLILLLPFCQSGEEKKDIEVIKIPLHIIEIKNDMVTEKIIFENIANHPYNNTLNIWLNTEEAKIKMDGVTDNFFLENNTILLNLSVYDFAIPPKGNISMDIEYEIKNKFERKIIYDTDKIEIKIQTNKFVRGNIPLKYENGIYFSSFDPKIGEKIIIEFEEREGQNILVFLMGIISIILGIFIILLAIRKRS